MIFSPTLILPTATGQVGDFPYPIIWLIKDLEYFFIGARHLIFSQSDSLLVKLFLFGPRALWMDNSSCFFFCSQTWLMDYYCLFLPESGLEWWIIVAFLFVDQSFIDGLFLAFLSRPRALWVGWIILLIFWTCAWLMDFCRHFISGSELFWWILLGFPFWKQGLNDGLL